MHHKAVPKLAMTEMVLFCAWTLPLMTEVFRGKEPSAWRHDSGQVAWAGAFALTEKELRPLESSP